MNKYLIVLLHIGFWLCYSFLILIVLTVYNRAIGGDSNHSFKIINALKTLFLFAIIPSIISYCSYYFFLFHKYLQKKKYFLSVLFGILMSFVVAVLFYFILRYFIENGYIIDMDEGGKHGRSTAGWVIFIMTFIGVICGTVALVIRGFITWFSEIKLRELLKEKNHEMELALIKSQLDPHLLFNTINNIDALILKDAVSASEYLNKLSDIMRFILYETKAGKISLSRELEYIGKYIDLQKIRTANESYVRYNVTGFAGNRQIVPMIFIPFIENAFKHSSNKKAENAIIVDVIIKEEATQLLCRNKIDNKLKTEKADGGLGNELIQKRLKLIYPEKHKLEVNDSNGIYSVNLSISNG